VGDDEKGSWHAFPKRPVLVGLLGFGLAVILYAGLGFRGFTFRKDVEWLEDGPVICPP
jgi:hypothetical protein